MSVVSRARKAGRPSLQPGFTLSEMMVALFIGLILATGVAQVFIKSQDSQRFQQAMARTQETGRFAIERMARDVRRAGYQGCGGDTMEFADYRDKIDKNPDDGTEEEDVTSFEGLFVDGIRGFSRETVQVDTDDDGETEEVEAEPNPPAVITPNDETEGLRLHFLERTDVVFAGSSGSSEGKSDSSGGSGLPSIPVEGTGGEAREPFKKCDVVFLEDKECGFARSFFAGSSGNSAKFNFNGTGDECKNFDHKDLADESQPWPDDVDGARAMRGRHVMYYIADEDGEPTLHRWDDTNGATALVSGISNMHIEYGLDTTDDPGDGVNEYSGVNAVQTDGDWGQVVAVRISLLMRSREDNLTDEPQTYNFPPGEENTASDHRLYQVFTRTIALRNSLP